MPDSIVIIPTYNEKENIEQMIRKVFSLPHDFHLLIIDDGSPDGTGERADRLAERIAGVSVLHRRHKEGLGPAYIAGFRRALASGAGLVLEMDSDFSHDPAYLPRLIEAAARADLVIGSRYVEGGNVQNWPKRRWVLSWTANTYARLALGIGIHDITAGYRAYRRDVLERIDLDHVDSKGYCFQIDLTWRTISNGFVVAEVPITFTERELGVSKMSGSNIREAVVKVAQWGIEGRLHRKRAAPVKQ